MRGCRMGGEGWRVFDGVAFDPRFPFYIPRGIVDEDWEDERLERQRGQQERTCTNNNITPHHTTPHHTATYNARQQHTLQKTKGRKPEGIIQHTHTHRLRRRHFTTPRREPGKLQHREMAPAASLPFFTSTYLPSNRQERDAGRD